MTDRFLFNNGYADQITSVLKAAGVETEVFFEVEADLDALSVRKALSWRTLQTGRSSRWAVVPDGRRENHGSCTNIRKPL